MVIAILKHHTNANVWRDKHLKFKKKAFDSWNVQLDIIAKIHQSLLIYCAYRRRVTLCFLTVPQVYF